MTDFQQVLTFWFDEIDEKSWWKKSPDFDALICSRFGEVHGAATRGELFQWRTTAKGRLAEVIVLDQFSRNLYRDRPAAFAWDSTALVLAQEAIAAGADRELPSRELSFLFMPFMHSESPAIHDIAEKLFRDAGLKDNLAFERRHREIIDRFGRYPHRNAILGRESTPDEEEFLRQPGAGF